MTKSDRLVTHILCYETIQCSSDHIRGSDVPFTKIKWYPASAWLKRTYNTMEDFVLQWYNKEVAATMNTKILGDLLIAGMPSTPKKYHVPQAGVYSAVPFFNHKVYHDWNNIWVWFINPMVAILRIIMCWISDSICWIYDNIISKYHHYQLSPSKMINPDSLGNLK